MVMVSVIDGRLGSDGSLTWDRRLMSDGRLRLDRRLRRARDLRLGIGFRQTVAHALRV